MCLGFPVSARNAENEERKVRSMGGFTAYIYGQKRVSARKVVNNCEGRGVALITNYNQFLIVVDVGLCLCHPFSSRSLCRVFVYDDIPLSEEYTVVCIFCLWLIVVVSCAQTGRTVKTIKMNSELK